MENEAQTMQALIEAITEENKQQLNKEINKIIASPEGYKQVCQWHRKTYKGTEGQQLIKLTRFLTNHYDARTDTQVKQICAAYNAPYFSGPLTITIEWKKSHMWGSNPTAYTNYGFKGRSIGGCGYDKKSTATAEALNSHLPILKLLYHAKGQQILNAAVLTNTDGTPMTTSDINRNKLGYGSGYNILPSFEGGVGWECHRRILEGLGLTMHQVTDSPNTDVFIINKA